MTGFKSKKAMARDKLKCQCSMTTKLVGSGCQYCNPEYWDDDDVQPPQRPWVGLTEEDFSAINQSCFTKLQAATSAESILKEKNNG